MQSLDTVSGGDGTDTLVIRDSVSITARSGSHSGIEILNVESTAGSVGQVAASATIAARQQVEYNFGAAGISLGGAATSIVSVNVGGVTRTVGSAATAATVQNIADAIEAILDDANGTAAGGNTYVSAVAANKFTVTSATAGVALPTITISAGSGGAGTFTATSASTDPFAKTIQANQKAADAVSTSTFSVMTGVTEATITAATTANVSSVSTAATTVSAGGNVILSGGASQTVATADSVQVSGGLGAISVATAVPGTALASVTGTGFGGGAGVFVRGGTTVSITETAGTSSSGAAPAGNATVIQIGANPASASGTAGANSGAFVSSALTGAEVIGNLSSAPTGNVTVTVRTTYTGTNGLTNVAYGTGAVTAFMNGGETASITGAGTVNITDLRTILTKASSTADALPGVSKLATVNLTGVTGATAIKSDAIATVSAVDTSSTITITSNVGANTGNIALNVANSTVTLVDADASSVSVGSAAGSGRQSVGGTLVAANQGSSVTLTTAKAASLAFSGANDVTLAASTLTALTSITSTASGTVNLGTVTGYSKLTSVNMSGGTGAVTVTIDDTITGAATDRGFAYTGSAGSDTVIIAGTLKSGTSAAGAAITNTVSLGAGNDTVVSDGTGVIAAGSSVNGGDGIDTIAASLLTAGNAALITGFELLGLDGASKDVDLLSGAVGLVAIGHGGTYTNVKTSQSLTVGGTVTGAGITTLTFAAAQVAGAADAYSINFAAKGSTSAAAPTTVNAGTYAIAGIENVNISSTQSSGFVSNSIDLTAANLKTVTVTGDALSTTLTFTGTNGTNGAAGGAVSSIDASAVTGKVVLNTANLVINNAADFSGLSVSTGAGADEVTLAQFAIVNSGAGNDTVTMAATGGVVTTGAGKDVVKVGLAVGTTALTTITDFAAGDTIDFINGTNGAHSATASAVSKLTLTTESSLADAIASAFAADPAAAGADVVWFQYGGNTYVVYDANGGAGAGTAGTDAVVKLTGLVDLSLSTFDATNGSFTFG